MEELNLTFVDEVVERVGTGGEKVLEILQAVQGHYGYLPREALERVCELTDITPASIVGVSTFYNQFRHRPVGRYIIHVCVGTACHARGALRVLEELERRLEIRAGETTEDRQFTLETVNCLGCCALAPVVVVGNDYHAAMVPGKISSLLKHYRETEH